MKKIGLLLIGITFFSGSNNLLAQTDFYDVDTIREIKIYFDQPNWDHLLDSLYAEDAQNRLVATYITIDGVQLDSIGIRYKGYSSANTARIKNPFNIKIDYIKGNQTYNGIDKIKLSNVIQDPSFVREVLSYEIARKYMPASKANYANVYVNDTLLGLYTNVESVGGEFLEGHYNSSDNPFFKGNPETLDLSGDDNSSLDSDLGTDSTLYYPRYTMKSDNGWSDLYNLIDTLNNYTEDIEKVLNVDRTIWMHAINFSLINFDSYVGYAQNYYLYKDNNGRFNPIIWDLNQSFASFRLTDASQFFGGFNILDAKNMDPFTHNDIYEAQKRPLIKKLFVKPRYRKMYIAHMRTIMEENIDNQDYYTRGQAMQALIDVSVQNDTNKFYTYADFQNNLTSTTTDLVDYAGITDLMDARNTYLSSYPGFQGAPDITNISSSPTTVSIGDSVWITTDVVNADSVILAFRYSSTELFTKVDMFDDGLHGDGVAGDNNYGYLLHNIGHTVEYYIYADNDTAGRFSPERAAYEYHNIIIDGDIVLNELCAINSGLWLDPQGQSDDWIELYNNSNSPVSLKGYYLSDDNSVLNKWEFPDTTIAANSYVIVWADKDTLDIGLHAAFKLSATGEAIFLSDSSGILIDEIIFGSQSASYVTYGRFPNGTGPWEYMNSSQADLNNSPVSVDEVELLEENSFVLFPNPANNLINVEIDAKGEFQVLLQDINGRILLSKKGTDSANRFSLDISNYSSGFYLITITNSKFTSTKKFIKK
jgi:spore coat protein CotH